MIEVDLKAGDIFTWQNYPLYDNELKSQRWLLYIGNDTINAIVYQITTTTQFQHYENNGRRINHNFFKIPAGIGGLERDSILDITRFFERVSESLFNKCKNDINKKGSLKQDFVNKFVNHC